MKKIKLGDVCRISSAGDKPSEFSNTLTDECRVPVVANGIENAGIIGYTSKPAIVEPAVTVSARGNVGSAFFRNTPYYPVIRLLTIIPNPDVLDVKYLYYYLKKYSIKGDGSVQAQITVPDADQYEIVAIEDISTQRKIARLLSCLDEKIENNNAICADLEGMAKLLYNYWFVQFDFPDENGKPYKSSGGKMVWNEELKREIPEGWNVTTIGNLFRVTMGTSPAGKDINESGEGTPFYQGKTDFGFRYPATRTYSTAPVRFAEKNDTLLSVRAPVGALNRAIEKSCIGRGVSAIHSQFPSFAYYTCLVLQPLFEKFNGDGTTFGCIGRDDLLAIPVVSPALQVIESFEALVSQNDALIEKCEKENRDLVSLRDFLLPMLMNGQVKVG